MAQQKPLLKCFVASAFDHSDVDAIFDRAIRPVLKQLGARADRVDRTEHNDDIDDKIFALMSRADFCIADITYARPSVYYEAGYIFGSGKPVVYIARSDHLRPRADDPHGNLRVHFDLQMKNIIPWTEPNDTLKAKLRSRLRHVLAPLVRAREIDAAAQTEKQRFAALSVNLQAATLATAAKRLVESRRYKGVPPPERLQLPPPNVHSATYSRTQGSVLRQIQLIASPKVPTGLFRESQLRDGLLYVLVPTITRRDYKKFERIESLLLLVGLTGPKEQTMRAGLSSWTPLGNKVFRNAEGFSLGSSTRHVVTLASIEGLKSLPEYAIKIREFLEAWEKDALGGA